LTASVRYRFAEFVLSPRQRLLLRNGTPVALIPKYFDLLHLLVRRRLDAVSKQDIFVEVWSDVVVTDGALSQAVRTLRRALGDDSREPRFIRTVARHGYQFVWADVSEERDEGPVRQAAESFPISQSPPPEPPDTVDALVDRLVAVSATGRVAGNEVEEARDLAERLHLMGTAEAMARITSKPRHASAVALMREARWNVPGAGDVPFISDAEAVGTVFALIRLRISSVRAQIARRWAGAAASGAIAGAAAGMCGGVILYLAPMSQARLQSSLALAAIGALAGGVGAGGVGAGLAAAEVLARSRRGLALTLCGAAAGALVALFGHALLRALLEGLVGGHYSYGGGAFDGLVLGAAAGAGYGLATRQPPGGGLAAPSGRARLKAAATVGVCCAVAAIVLAMTDRLLVGGLVHDIARASRDAQLVLAPLGHLIGEPGFGPVTRAILSAFEGGTFGCALTWGLTRR
jgi:transcriptional regulator HilA, main transcriptional regulator of SPI1